MPMWFVFLNASMECYATDLTLSFGAFLFPFIVIFKFYYLLPCITCSVAMPQHVPQSLLNPPCVECLLINYLLSISKQCQSVN